MTLLSVVASGRKWYTLSSTPLTLIVPGYTQDPTSSAGAPDPNGIRWYSAEMNLSTNAWSIPTATAACQLLLLGF